jgi:hypothetical protein
MWGLTFEDCLELLVKQLSNYSNSFSLYIDLMGFVTNWVNVLKYVPSLDQLGNPNHYNTPQDLILQSPKKL